MLHEVCRCSVNFINVLLRDNSRSVAVHGVYFGRMFSPLSRNDHVCSIRFGILSKRNRFSSNSVNDYVKSNESNGLESDATLLFEFCFVGDDDFCLPRFSSQEISQMISMD